MRWRFLIALVFVTPLGFATKLYEGPGADWVRYSASGVLYVVFWVLAVLVARPRGSPVRVAAGVFAATSLLEVLQLWQPAFLQSVRATFLGATLLGTTFSWWDFPHYALGCAAGALLARRLGANLD